MVLKCMIFALDIQTTVLFSFCEFNASSQFKQRKDLCDLSGEFKYKSDISNRCFILQFQRPETRVNLANAHAIDINNNEERYMLLHLLFLSQILNSQNEGKKFRTLCRTPMLSLNARKIIAVKYTT